jgi:lipoprotein-releasing system permease protein
VELVWLVWEALLGIGTTLTLSVIVMIALALAALALFYVSSAVVVLERFARTVQRARWVFFFGAIISAAFAAFAARMVVDLDLLGGQARDSLLLLSLVPAAGVTAISIGIVWLVLRKLSSGQLGRLMLVVMGTSTAFLVASTGRMGLAVAPFLAVVAYVVLRALLRRIRSGSSPVASTSLSRGAPLFRGASLFRGAPLFLGVPLALGPVLVLGVPEPGLHLVAVGSTLLQLVWIFVVSGLLPLAAAGLVEMRHSVEWFLAIRYLVARRRQVYISAITVLCIGGIATGVWLIVTVLSVMNGFERAWREQIIGDLAHFTVHSGLGRIHDYEPVLEIVRGVANVEAASPYLDAEGMVRSANGKLFGVRLRGIDPETADRVTEIGSRMKSGSLAALRPEPSEDGSRAPPAIVIGEPLAKKLGVELGDDLVLISPLGGPPTPLGPAPRLKKFRVAGVYRSRLHQFGEVYTYVDLTAAQDFVRAENAIDGIEARTSDLYTSRRVADAVRARLDSPYYTRDWKDHFPVFFAALRDNRAMMILLLGMVMVVAAFMIVATLMMMIMEKSSDIAILKAMGAEDATIERVFAIEGALIGMAGTSLGVVAGLAVTARLDWIQRTIEAVTGVDTLPASIYQLETLPADHDPVQLAWIVAMAMVLSLGATLVPARQGARFDPVEGLRSE